MVRGTSITDAEFIVKEGHVREWVRRKLGCVAHEVRVARLAEMLFQLTRRWHDLAKAESRLLTLGCLVHDVGRAEGEAGHAKTGARMVLETDNLPLTDTERRRLAFLTRHHRGNVPDPGTERFLDPELDTSRVMRTLLGLLRVADALDSRTLGGCPQIIATVRGKVVTVYGYVSGDVALAAAKLGKPKKLRLLETTLDCQMRTEWFNMDRLGMVS